MYYRRHHIDQADQLSLHLVLKESEDVDEIVMLKNVLKNYLE